MKRNQTQESVIIIFRRKFDSNTTIIEIIKVTLIFFKNFNSYITKSRFVRSFIYI